MRNRRNARYVLGAVALLLALISAGCEQKTINEIKADPGRYANREVGIVGTVAKSYSVLGKGAYEVSDETGKLWVISTRSVPREGARIAVKGKIKDGFNLSSIVNLPGPINSGMVMIESSHKAQ